jgi:hypothetical protein
MSDGFEEEEYLAPPIFHPNNWDDGYHEGNKWDCDPEPGGVWAKEYIAFRNLDRECDFTGMRSFLEANTAFASGWPDVLLMHSDYWVFLFVALPHNGVEKWQKDVQYLRNVFEPLIGGRESVRKFMDGTVIDACYHEYRPATEFALEVYKYDFEFALTWPGDKCFKGGWQWGLNAAPHFSTEAVDRIRWW